MKKLKKTLIILTLLIAVFVMREYDTTTNSYITKQHWKIYDDSQVFGDAFAFNDKLTLKNDTIFKNKEPLAVVVKVTYRPLIENFITIEDVKTKEQATYIGK